LFKVADRDVSGTYNNFFSETFVEFVTIYYGVTNSTNLPMSKILLKVIKIMIKIIKRIM
jgi:hypothetical protein